MCVCVFLLSLYQTQITPGSSRRLSQRVFFPRLVVLTALIVAFPSSLQTPAPTHTLSLTHTHTHTLLGCICLYVPLYMVSDLLFSCLFWILVREIDDIM